MRIAAATAASGSARGDGARFSGLRGSRRQRVSYPCRFVQACSRLHADGYQAKALREIRGAIRGGVEFAQEPANDATCYAQVASLFGGVGYGLCLPLRADASDAGMGQAYAMLLSTRPTAVNLKWALDEVVAAVRNRPRSERVAAAYARAAAICREDIADNEAIGRHGLAVIEGVAAAKPPGGRVNLRCTGCWKKPARSPRQRNLCSTASPTPSKKGFIALQRLRPPPIRKSLRHCQ
jgi:hypothetical protein